MAHDFESYRIQDFLYKFFIGGFFSSDDRITLFVTYTGQPNSIYIHLSNQIVTGTELVLGRAKTIPDLAKALRVGLIDVTDRAMISM